MIQPKKNKKSFESNGMDSYEYSNKSSSLEGQFLDLDGKIITDRFIKQDLFLSKKLLEVYIQVEKLAKLDFPILIYGASGSGKESIAKRIHEESGRDGNFEAVNCRSIPEKLFESEMFGHVKGAFTDAYKTTEGYFQKAEGGTLFLDEIDKTSLSSQDKLLRALEYNYSRVGGDEVFIPNIKFVFATNRDLWSLVNKGEFSKDLFFRIKKAKVHLPSIYEYDRCEKIKLLNDLNDKFSKKMNRHLLEFDKESINAWCTYELPGNFREAESILIELYINKDVDNNRVTAEDLRKCFLTPFEDDKNDNIYFSVNDKVTSNEIDERYTKFVLKDCNDDIEEASEILGIKRSTLYERLKNYRSNFLENNSN